MEDIYKSFDVKTNSSAFKLRWCNVTKRKRKHSDTNSIIRIPTPFNFNDISCCICDSEFEEYKCLSTVKKNEVRDDIGIYPCCGNHEHAICKIIHSSALNFANHPIKGNSNKFHCIHHERLMKIVGYLMI